MISKKSPKRAPLDEIRNKAIELAKKIGKKINLLDLLKYSCKTKGNLNKMEKAKILMLAAEPKRELFEKNLK